MLVVISADNLASCIASGGLHRLPVSLTNVNIRPRSTRCSAPMLLLPKFLAGYSGSYVDRSATATFTATALLGLPGTAAALASRLKPPAALPTCGSGCQTQPFTATLQRPNTCTAARTMSSYKAFDALKDEASHDSTAFDDRATPAWPPWWASIASLATASRTDRRCQWAGRCKPARQTW
jgi:hypothetical protein